MTAVPNGVLISLDVLLETRARWVAQVCAQRPPWYRPLARALWRVEVEMLERMTVGDVAARLRGA